MVLRLRTIWSSKSRAWKKIFPYKKKFFFHFFFYYYVHSYGNLSWFTHVVFVSSIFFLSFRSWVAKKNKYKNARFGRGPYGPQAEDHMVLEKSGVKKIFSTWWKIFFFKKKNSFGIQSPLQNTFFFCAATLRGQNISRETKDLVFFRGRSLKFSQFPRHNFL